MYVIELRISEFDKFGALFHIEGPIKNSFVLR